MSESRSIRWPMSAERWSRPRHRGAYLHILSIGFFIYIISEMHNLLSCGLMMGLMILFVFLADFVVASALMDILHPKK